MGSSQKQRWLCLSRQMKENTRNLAGPDSIDKHPELIFFLKAFCFFSTFTRAIVCIGVVSIGTVDIVHGEIRNLLKNTLSDSINGEQNLLSNCNY